jgi:hypothetical protein
MIPETTAVAPVDVVEVWLVVALLAEVVVDVICVPDVVVVDRVDVVVVVDVEPLELLVVVVDEVEVVVVDVVVVGGTTLKWSFLVVPPTSPGSWLTRTLYDPPGLVVSR